MSIIDEIKWNNDGLVPVVTTDAVTGEVLMQAYMNAEAFNLTLEKGEAYYYSRSRGELWRKGATSGHTQKVVSVALDCDKDCVLLKVIQKGVACHTGEYSCFFNVVKEFDKIYNASVLYEDIKVINDRAENRAEGSYTNYLLDEGVDKICKKIGEEAAEVIIAAKNNSAEELSMELADLYFHTLVLMKNQGLDISQVFKVLKERRTKARRQDYASNKADKK